MYANLTEDENALLTHISRWGSDGYPLNHLKRGWTWDYRGIKGPPEPPDYCDEERGWNDTL